jgi:hypothetical protein
MARAGKLPGAARVGRDWTFDRDKLTAFIEQRESETCQQEGRPRPVATGAVTYYGRRPTLRASDTSGHCIQAIRNLQRRAGTLKKSA